MATVSAGFDPRLESLRGVASFSVVLAHSLAVLRIDGVPAFWTVPISDLSTAGIVATLFSAVFNAASAVVVFFMLSGYVLALSLLRTEARGGLINQIPIFYLRRALRLLPAMWVSILFFAIVLHLSPYPSVRGVFSDWFDSMFVRNQIGLPEIAANFVLANFTVNPVTWTMYVEVAGSLAVPFLFYCNRRYGVAAGSGLVLLLVAISVYFPTVLATQYLFCFALGVLLACHPGINIMHRCAGIVFALALTLFVIERLMLVTHPRQSVLVNATGAALLLASLLARSDSGISAILASAPLRFIGKISYSLYLFHSPVLYAVGLVIAAAGIVGLSANVLAVLLGGLLSIGVAWVAYEWVEWPMMRLARSDLTLFKARPAQV